MVRLTIVKTARGATGPIRSPAGPVYPSWSQLLPVTSTTLVIRLRTVTTFRGATWTYSFPSSRPGTFAYSRTHYYLSPYPLRTQNGLLVKLLTKLTTELTVLLMVVFVVALILVLKNALIGLKNELFIVLILVMIVLLTLVLAALFTVV